MAMMDEVILRQALRTQLLTVSSLPRAEYRAWENQVFDPPSPDENPHGEEPLWFREILRILSESKSSTGYIEAVGEYLIMVETPKGRGTEDADALAKAIADVFQPGQSLTKSGTTVILERTDRRPYLEDSERPAWVFKTISVRWRTFTAA